MKVNDMVVEKTSTEYDYTIMHVKEINEDKVICNWINDYGEFETKLFNIKELEVFVED